MYKIMNDEQISSAKKNNKLAFNHTRHNSRHCQPFFRKLNSNINIPTIIIIVILFLTVSELLIKSQSISNSEKML